MTDLETRLRGALADAADAVRPRPDAWAEHQRRSAKSGRSRNTRFTLSIAAAAVGTAAVVVGGFALANNHSSDPAKVNGPSGIQRTLTPTHHLSQLGLKDAAHIISARLKAAGVTNSTVIPTSNAIRAYVPAASLGALAAVATSKGVLRFRQALEIKDGGQSSKANPAHLTTYAPTLTPALQHGFNAWNCKTNPGPTGGREAASDYMIACSTQDNQKYLLAPSTVAGSNITSADAVMNDVSSNDWVVALNFDGPGSEAWQKVTERAYNVNHGQPQTTPCNPPKGCDAVAITLDGVVQSAPYISSAGGIPGGVAQISGNFSESDAELLAAILRYGALPTTFEVREPVSTH